jgi:general secretion pathway protein G
MWFYQLLQREVLTWMTLNRSVIEGHKTTKEKSKMSYDKTATYSIPAFTKRKRALCSLGNRGFTLIELIVVMAILGVLATLAIAAYGAIKDKAREARCMTEIRELEKVINAMAIDKGGVYPSSAEVAQIAPTDPWGNSYVYVNVATDGGSVLRRKDGFDFLNFDFDLYSKGANGQAPQDIGDPLSLDDIVRAGDGGFVGVVANY